ncbi:serine protease inhibitor 42Dd [Anastrepha ludens]|uniref:serine protease inhibitor 42Dd n=1 Tax=Anastrepha ludens TaxID=28586 RepID=UPI0023B0CC95|nr:serine protease inhibitor 42Dd [Anastrepha ludens]
MRWFIAILFLFNHLLSRDVAANAIQDRNLFATELFQTIAADKQHENVIISPVAIQTALGLAYYGADGQTATELQKSLHAQSQSRSTIAKSYYKLLHSFVKPKTILEIANKIYAKDALVIEPEFRDAARKYFDSDAEQLDFTDEPKAVELINDWLAKKTNGKIEHVLDSIEPDINVALVNAIYFKAKWARPFMDDETSDRPFWINDNESVNVSTMFADNWYNYADYEELDAKAIELFFENTDLRMWFILPNKRNGLNELEQKLKGVDFNALEKRWEWSSVTVNLPKFKFEFDTDLKPYLLKLGIRTMFTDEADFSNMFHNSPISTRVSRVQHKAFIDVNEIGCEAAAASVAVGVPMSLPWDPKTFIADHPFVFIIRDEHAIYFTGHIARF